MPSYIELTAYMLPASASPDRPAKIIMCPFCMRFHVCGLPAHFVILPCVWKEGALYAYLHDCGLAIRPMLEAFASNADIPQDSPLWQLQPHNLWSETHEITDEFAQRLNPVKIS